MNNLIEQKPKSASQRLFIYADLQLEVGQLAEVQRFRDEVARDIDAYAKGGPWLKRKHLDRACALGLDEGEIVRVWSEALRRKSDAVEAGTWEAGKRKPEQAKREAEPDAANECPQALVPVGFAPLGSDE